MQALKASIAAGAGTSNVTAIPERKPAKRAPRAGAAQKSKATR